MVADYVNFPGPAVNTLYRSNDGWLGCLTDISGLEADLKQREIDIFSAKTWLIFGSGDMAASLIHRYIGGANYRLPAKIYVFGRNHHEDWPRRHRLPDLEKFGDISFLSYSFENLQIGLNALSEGDPLFICAPGEELSVYLNERSLDLRQMLSGKKIRVIDMNYLPYHFPQLAEVDKIDGLGMLIEQARLAQEVWFSKKLDPVTYRKRALEAIAGAK